MASPLNNKIISTSNVKSRFLIKLFSILVLRLSTVNVAFTCTKCTVHGWRWSCTNLEVWFYNKTRPRKIYVFIYIYICWVKCFIKLQDLHNFSFCTPLDSTLDCEKCIEFLYSQNNKDIKHSAISMHIQEYYCLLQVKVQCSKKCTKKTP